MQNVVTSEGATWGSLPGSMMWLFRFLFWAYNYQDFENSETPTFTKFLFVTYAIATSKKSEVLIQVTDPFLTITLV